MPVDGLSSVARVITPGADDWIVTLCLHSGAVVNRRVTPGRIAEVQAVRAAMQSQSVRPCHVADVIIRRAGEEKKIVVETDEFQELLKRAKRE